MFQCTQMTQLYMKTLMKTYSSSLESAENENSGELNKWFKLNKPSLDVTKTKLMIFRKNIYINLSEFILESEAFNFHFDYTLTWKNHVSVVCTIKSLFTLSIS